MRCNGLAGMEKKYPDGKIVLNTAFDDDEFEKLLEMRNKSIAVNWHDFILLSFGIINEEDLKRRK